MTSCCGDKLEGEGVALERAYRIAYAPLRSAQHALDIIGRSSWSTERNRDLAREESNRIEQAIEALRAMTARQPLSQGSSNVR